MYWLLLLVAVVIILSMAFKSYANKPRILELRELSQEKASLGDAMKTTGKILQKL